MRPHLNNRIGVCRSKATGTKPGDQQCKSCKGETLPGRLWKTLPQQLGREVAELQGENRLQTEGLSVSKADIGQVSKQSDVLL